MNEKIEKRLEMGKRMKVRVFTKGYMNYLDDFGMITYGYNGWTYWSELNHVADLDAVFMWYVGLADKNKKDIYEGDIIIGDDNTMVVGWSDRFASFVLSKNGWMFSHWFGESCDPKDIEVIGNIYENENILK